MAEPRWLMLRQRLQDGGIAPRRIRRLLDELRTHYRELLAEEQQSGADRAAAGELALQRLGSEEVLVSRMLAQRNLLCWSRRWPWAVYGIGSLLLFAAGFVAGCALVTGMSALLQDRAQHVLAGRTLLQAIALLVVYGLPVASSAAMVLLAVRRRVPLIWAACAVGLVCLLGALTNLDVRVRTVSAGIGLSTHSLAVLLLHRWLPTALAAVALAVVSLWAARTLERHQAPEPDQGLP